LFQFGEGRNCTIFTKIGTKLKQKLEYRDQIETEELTPGIILTPSIITATSLCHWHVVRRQFDTWQILFKKNKKKSRNWHMTSHLTLLLYH